MSRRVRAVVLTATMTEYRAVLDLLSGLRSVESASGMPYTCGVVETSRGTLQVWAGCVGQGNVNAALQASQAIHELQPFVIAFLGTAGAVGRDVRLGDVVFASKVYGYEAGKQTDARMLARPEVVNTDPLLTAFARRIGASDDWNTDSAGPYGAAAAPDGADLDHPRVHVAPIAAGEKIQQGERQDLREHLRASFNDAVAVDMEGLGFLTAAQQWGDTKAVVVRGISDVLHDKSPEHDARVQPLACRNAARFLAQLLIECRPALTKPESGQYWNLSGRGVADMPTFVPAGERHGGATLTRTDLPSPDLSGVSVTAAYRLVREIGRGALNSVWEAEERAFGRTLGRVAIKLQPPAGGKRYRYFTREASTMAAFDSPFVIPYRSAGTVRSGELAGWSYIATALADVSLRAWVNEEPLAGRGLLSMLLDVARGLHHLHARRLVHGDVKPANILRYEDRWVLGDFGLTQPTGAREPEGTLGYMAPERFEGRVQTGNDVYSFAITAAVAASRLQRNEDSTVDNTMRRVLTYLRSNVPTRPAIDFYPFPEPVRTLLYAALSVDPANRPSMHTLVAELAGRES